MRVGSQGSNGPWGATEGAPPGRPSPTEDALLHQMAELQAQRAELEEKLAAQEARLAGQEARLAALGEKLDQQAAQVIDQATRDLLGYAIGADEQGFARCLSATGDESFLVCLSQCVRVAGYVVIDGCSGQWPTEADLHQIARRITGLPDLDFGVSEADNFAFLSRSALGFEPLSSVFPDIGKLGSIPIFATATLLTAYSPDGMRWEGYLTVIERSLDLVGRLPDEAVPAVLLLARRYRALKDTC
jgi:hypothetical protein